MSSIYKKIGEIKEVITLQVSARGCGLCLYLPKQLCETYGVTAGHRLKVVIRDHFRPVPNETLVRSAHSLDKLHKGKKKSKARESEEAKSEDDLSKME